MSGNNFIREIEDGSIEKFTDLAMMTLLTEL